MRSETRGKSRVLKISAAQVVVERGRVSRKISFYEIKVAVQIVVGCRDPHACLRLAIGTERATSLDRDVHEFSVFLVLVKSAGSGIVSHVDVGPTVVIEIARKHAKAKCAVCLKNSGLLRDIRKGSVSVVVVQDIFA